MLIIYINDYLFYFLDTFIKVSKYRLPLFSRNNLNSNDSSKQWILIYEIAISGWYIKPKFIMS